MKTRLQKTIFFLLFTTAGIYSLYGQEKVKFTLGDSSFLLNEKPFLMISGEMHYTRIPVEYWRHRLKMAKAMGLNTIGTYIFWNVHEPTRGNYNFTGNNNISHFLQLAKEEGLWVVLRPSPYACAEWEFGGYPWWLLKDSTVKVRSKDPRFFDAYKAYLKRLSREITPHLVTNGGNILMVQLENEYGSYSDDKEYLDMNRKIFREVGFDGVLFTCDGADKMIYGYLPGFLPAVNGLEKTDEIKELIRQYHNGKGPYYVAEWYPGWFDQWGKPHAQVSAERTSDKLDKILSEGISINMYMFHGGTTRGFMNGANMNINEPYAPQVSGYDYDAPLDEAGNPTEKFHMFRQVIARHLPPGEEPFAIPEAIPAIQINPISFADRALLFDNLPAPVFSDRPLSFEEMDQAYGFVLYRHIFKNSVTGTLMIPGLRDYAIVFLNGKRMGVLDRRLNEDSIMLGTIPQNAVLDILVENNGRINYGPYLTDNRKGLIESVQINKKDIREWAMYKLPFQTLAGLKYKKTFNKVPPGQPAFYRASFLLSETGDTYLDMREFGKGFVFLNGHNLGKYWQIGPQQTIYVPSVWLKKGVNEIIVFDQLYENHSVIETLTIPILNQLRTMK